MNEEMNHYTLFDLSWLNVDIQIVQSKGFLIPYLQYVLTISGNGEVINVVFVLMCSIIPWNIAGITKNPTKNSKYIEHY